MPDAAVSAGRPDWRGIALFYVIACAVSGPLLLWRDLAPESWAASPIPAWLRPLLYGWGPAIGAIVVLRLRRAQHRRTITWTGGAPLASLFAVLFPVALLAAWAPARTAASPHWAGLIAGTHAVAYALGEELGWRGYLQDALRPIRPWPRWLLLGLMWGVWHMLTFAGHGSLGERLGRLAIFYAVLVLASAAIGNAVERSRSLLVATACHLFYTYSQMHTGRDRWGLLAILIPTTMLLVRFWPVPEQHETAPVG